MRMPFSTDTVALSAYTPEANSLTGSTVLITGAAGALGSAIAKSASTLGCELILLDKNDRALNKLFDEIFELTGVEAGLYPLDLAGANVDDYQALAQTIEAEFGALNGLIHCAVELGQLAPLSYTDAAQWQKTFATNVHGPVFLTSALMSLMRNSTPASIVFSVDDKAKAYWNSYAATKAAIMAAMKTLSDELDTDKDNDGNLKITCNAVLPAIMRSSLRSSAFPGEDPATLPDAQHNVPAYLYLLSNAARQINGKVIVAKNEN